MRGISRARECAAGLAAGQHPAGGWHYFIDFEPDGVRAYYDEFFSQCWGWQEYSKFRNNSTFDDYTTTEATRFFLRLWRVTRNAEHKAVLDRALAMILPRRTPPEAGRGAIRPSRAGRTTPPR